MRVERLRLRNFKCYEDADVRLDEGVTVIHGLNGSGKSSLLEATFFALYGATALDRTLDEVVTIGAEEAEVEVVFRHDGADYRLHRRVRATGERASTPDCTLEGPDGTVEGVTDVEARIADLLRMDADAFVNCAYVRQGEVNKLINATPGQRQDMIDDLLQLGKLETYRARAGDARLGVEDVLGTARGRLEQLDDQIADLEDADLHERRNALQTELNEVDADVEEYEENREEAEETLAEAEETLGEYEQRREEVADLDEEIKTLREAIEETESEREDLATERAEHREQVAALDERVADLTAETDLADPTPETVAERRGDLADRRDALESDLQDLVTALAEAGNEADRAEERASDLAERATEKREEADAVADRVADLDDDVDETRERIAELDEEMAAERATFEDAPVEAGAADDLCERLADERADLQERIQDRREELASVADRLAEAEELREAGKCPTCGQPVADSPHVDAIGDRREERDALEATVADLEDELAALDERIERADALREAESRIADLERTRELAEERLADRRRERDEKADRVADLREAAADLESEAEAAREAAAAARERRADLQSELGELNAEKATVVERLETLESLETALRERADHEREAQRAAERRADLADRNDERRDRLTDRRERRADLQERFDEQRVEAAREDAARAEQYLERVEGELDDLRERRDELVGQVSAVESRLDDLESLRGDREALQTRVDALESLHGETEALEEMYGDLRAELRRQNVHRLEALLNETFETVYGNDAYARIELDQSYELTVYQKDGEPLDPEQLSGGERALFNLSLRVAIYHLLAEGIDGGAPMPPLILDEPTVFLDEGHVSRLASLVAETRGWGVEQVLLVSHDAELVGAADHLVRVRKDATTNRSHVERAAPTTLSE
ncbi:MAG: DNA double-strand break repair ATPase Rad50 [Halobacteriaceae archaeon]